MTLAATAVALLAVAACDEQSRVDPNAELRIEGGAVAPDGNPLVERPVRLGTGVGTAEGGFAFLTLGLSCTGGGCRGKVFDTETDAAGNYAFVLKGRDTQSSFGEALSLLVTTSAAPGRGQVSGPSTSARFRAQVEHVRIPKLELVDPGLVLDTKDGLTARWSTTRAGPYELTFELAEEVPVWRIGVVGDIASFDPRVLEDTAGRAVVAAGNEDAVEGSKVNIRWRSPGIPYASAIGAPASRGRSCRYVDEATAATKPQPSCELTDGDLVESSSSPFICPEPAETTSTTPCVRPTRVVVDLGRPVPAELVVVRGCEGACAVDVSTDGITFQPAGAANGEHGLVPLDGRMVTAVRVGLGQTTGSDLREISVWGPTPARPALRPIASDDEGRLRRSFEGGTDDDGLPVLLLVAAFVLVAATLIGVGFVIGRRRARSSR